MMISEEIRMFSRSLSLIIVIFVATNMTLTSLGGPNSLIFLERGPAQTSQDRFHDEYNGNYTLAEINMEIDILFYVDTTGDFRIRHSSIEPGSQGEVKQYITRTIEIPGSISSVEVKMNDPVDTRFDAVPYIIPEIIGEGDPLPHPDWAGSLEENVNPDWTYSTAGMYDGKTILNIHIKPVTLRVDGSSWAYSSAVIKVKYVPITQKISDLLNSTKTLGQIKYLIITHDDLYESILPLARWKSQKGIFTKVVTTEDIKNKYSSGDIQTKMRRYIMEVESEHDLDYLLLLGDVDLVKTRNTKNIHPETAYGEGPTFATDGYFACVDEGTTWNSDGDSQFAEGNELDDPTPDMAVGRLSLNNPQDISELVLDLIEREKNFTWDQKMKDAVFFAGDPGSVPGYPPDTLEYFWDTYASNVFDSRETIYYDGSGNKTFNSQSFIDTVGDKYQALCYFSHGTETGLPGLFSSSQIGSLHNTGPEGVMFAMACLTGRFDGTTDCFGEAITTKPGKGLLGYIGSSRLAVGSIDQYYSGDAPGLEEDYWRYIEQSAIGNITPTIGDVYRNAISNFVSSFYPFPTTYYGYTPFRTYLEYNLFGEPEAPLFFHDPDILNMAYNLSDDKTYVTADVTNGSGQSVDGAHVTLYRNNQLGVTKITNSSGQVNITIPPSNGGRVNITAWKNGELPVNYSFTLPDLLAPTPLYSIDPEEPDGFNDIYITEPNITLFADEDCFIDYSIDGKMQDTDQWSPTFIAGQQGEHTISFRATDMIGHSSEWMNFTYSLDSRKPELWVDTEPKDTDGFEGWFITSPTLTLNSSEGLSETYYKIDDGGETTYNGPFKISEGVHLLTFRACDMAGNMNFSTISLKIDSTTPSSTFEISHEPDGWNGYYFTRPSIILKAYDVNGAIPQYRWDGEDWINYSGVIYPEKGIHLLEHRAMDSTGNIELTIGEHEIKYDPDPPDMEIEVYPNRPDGENGYYVSRPHVNISINNTVESGETEIKFILIEPGNGFDWSNDSINYYDPLKIPEGNWILHVLAIDAAGNKDYPQPIFFKVDLTFPRIDLNITPSQPDGDDNWYHTIPVIEILNISFDSRALYQFDKAGPWIEVKEMMTLQYGFHTISVKAIDIAGNIGSIINFSYKCDDSDPVAILSSPSLTYYVNESFEIYAGSSFDENGIKLYHFYRSNESNSIWTDSSQWNVTFKSTGNFSIWLEVIDPSGRSNKSGPLNISIIERPQQPPVRNGDTTMILPYDPDPSSSNSWTDPTEEGEIFLRGAIIIILIMIVCLLLMFVIRKRSIKEVEWEDDDAWLNEDWVDMDLDEEPVHEDYVTIFE